MNSPKMDCKQSNLEFMHNADLPRSGTGRRYLIGAYKGFTLLNNESNANRMASFVLYMKRQIQKRPSKPA